MGLSPEHHAELNYLPGVSPGRYDELRALYAHDPVALQQIDVYDGQSSYARLWRKYRDSLLAGEEDVETYNELLRGWPDI